MFFHFIKIFPFRSVIEILSNDKCTMEKITEMHNKYPIDKINDSANFIIKTFQNEMRERYRVPPPMVEKFKDDICFMIDIGFTYIEVVEPRMLYVEPLGYDILEGEIEKICINDP